MRLLIHTQFRRVIKLCRMIAVKSELSYLPVLSHKRIICYVNRIAVFERRQILVIVLFHAFPVHGLGLVRMKYRVRFSCLCVFPEIAFRIVLKFAVIVFVFVYADIPCRCCIARSAF